MFAICNCVYDPTGKLTKCVKFKSFWNQKHFYLMRKRDVWKRWFRFFLFLRVVKSRVFYKKERVNHIIKLTWYMLFYKKNVPDGRAEIYFVIINNRKGFFLKLWRLLPLLLDLDNREQENTWPGNQRAHSNIFHVSPTTYQHIYYYWTLY